MAPRANLHGQGDAINVAGADQDLPSIGEGEDQFAPASAAHPAHEAQVDDDRPVAPDEPCGIDPLLQRADGVAHEMGDAAGVKLDIIALGEDVIDLLQRLTVKTVRPPDPDLSLVCGGPGRLL